MTPPKQDLVSHRSRWLAIAGLCALLVGLIGLLILDAPLWHRQRLTLTTPRGDRLAATYYPGDSDAGVLLLEGFGSDQHMMRSAVREFVGQGAHVLTFDYSGHGRSPGALTYDNAATDRLARQVQAAMTELQRLSSLEPGHITWMGHSLGARVALQSAVLGPVRPAQLILVGAQINLGANAQSEFFTGTSDAGLDWVQALGPNTPPAPVQLLTGAWDDIITPEAARTLMTKLCGAAVTTCDQGNAREWVLYDAMFHNYEIYDPRALADAVGVAGAPAAGARIALWIVTGAGLALGLVGLLGITRPQSRGETRDDFRISHPKRFLWSKLWLWAAALPTVALVMGLTMLIPLPNPTFNLIYVGFFGGYGLLTFILYLLGRMPGVAGRLRLAQHGRWDSAASARALGFNLALFAALTVLYRSGLGMAPPTGVRLVWLLIFTPLTALGFWLGGLESSALSAAAPQKPLYRVLALASGLMPFVLYMLLLASLGSISGVLGALTGLGVLALSLMQGEITRRLSGSPALAAVAQSLLIYWLILPSGALFPPVF